MQFITVALTGFAAVAVAQQNSTSLPDLISQLPTCAVPCFESGASAANCSTTDLLCLCGQGKGTFVTSAATCLVTSCEGDQFNSAASTAGRICDIVATNPDPTALASASVVVTSVLGAASATTSPDAAVRPEVGLGILGIVAAAALAL